MQTVKANAIFDTYRFDAVEGEIGPGGKATVKIDLASINSSIDVRDVRLRFLLFETYKFPFAEIKADIDQSRLQELLTATRIEYTLVITLSMRGVVREIKTKVWVTRISDTTVSVATIEPIIVTAESVGLTKNIAKLVEVIKWNTDRDGRFHYLRSGIRNGEVGPGPCYGTGGPRGDES